MSWKQHILNMFTGKDNQTLDIGRIIWFKAALVFLGLAIYHVVKNHAPFDYQAFGIGFGAVMAGGGAALWAKSETEPGHEK
jgi:hypothetical protein